ncbi:MAG: HPr kinase/phosphorylase [Candidatus Abyssobacteria bacterium SURF_17]|uniref:HPr kinase/phosphorylase n=1 Tax=Candidatus Abyssobacteria bacterium SURF_17 TaxID=2093361 RepID=A0A419EW97_9BACT|nr:MAG: HPr kinase/phosphorylase [Candidatus Abyssubacteria bacterium SURF_17]
MIKSLTVADFIERTKENLKIQTIAGHSGLERTIAIPDINRPGLALAGYLDFFAFDRVQVMGLTEVNYMRQLDEATLSERLQRVFKYEVPCFIITRGLTPPEGFVEQANRASVPVLRSLLTTTKVVSKIIIFLDNQFSPETSLHGVLVDVYGVGVMIMGRAGVGKSECALELIERGHRLVADDVVFIRRRGDRFLYGEGSALLRHHMEIRGLGIFDVKNIFGVGAVRNTKRVGLIVELEDWDSSKEYDRIGISEDSYTILEVKLPKITVPVRPGRNMAIIIEVAALNHRLKEMGLDSEKLLTERLTQVLTSPDKDQDDFEP